MEYKVYKVLSEVMKFKVLPYEIAGYKHTFLRN